MQTENAKPESDELPHEMSLGDLTWSYAEDETRGNFYPLLERLLNTEQIPMAIELLKIRALNRIHEDIDAIAVKGIGTHIAKLANALDHMDDYGIGKRLDE
jgi:hypothetical protein